MDILDQLINQTSQGFECARKLYKMRRRDAPQAREVSNTIIDILGGTSKACFFLDAIDECAPHQRRGILSELEHIQKKTRVGIVMTDRVGSDKSTYPHNHAQNRDFIELRALGADIGQYLQDSLDERGDRDGEQYAWVHEDETRKDVIEKIIAASGDM